jgi:hypothetical protein
MWASLGQAATGLGFSVFHLVLVHLLSLAISRMKYHALV